MPIMGNVVPKGISRTPLVLVAPGVGAGVGTTQGVIVLTSPDEAEHELADGQVVHCS